MYFKHTSRLVAIKFLGLFGTTQTHTSVQDLSGDDFKTDETRIPEKQVYRDDKLKIRDQYKEAKSDSSKRIFGLMLEKGIPGLTICVSKKGQIIWHKAFGFCDVENQLECQPEARMRIASISKPLFVSTIVGPLMDEQKVDLRSSIYNFISTDEFPKKKYDDRDVDITIEQLLSHTSGIRHYDEGGDKDQPLRPIGSAGSLKVHQCEDQFNRKGFFQRETFRGVSEALGPFKDDPLLSEPGAKKNYTTYGYTLLSAVIEKIYNNAAKDEEIKQIEDYWMKTLRCDWGMENTSLDQDEPIISNRARYYVRSGRNGSLINAPYTDNSVKWAGGGLNSTVSDLVKFGSALIESYKGKEGAKLKSETVKRLWTEVKDSYGLGFQIEKLENKMSMTEKVAIYHLGGALGASSALILYPETEVVVAILVNLGRVNLRPLGLYIADQFARDD